ncbi:leucine-rich repeat domain-containing protein [Skeletonema marinoi]|uniref:Leucine-rich repeat domain-containing protein n=1 Tax=Skeletonema marinoi TaxID=267567 RepID=A0AAD8Y4J5_9STRA|nr:leucine-rich repeat domain-containing protein [Skeletonema marinoi]
MADHADDGDGVGDIFIYRGGRAHLHVTRVVIDKSVEEIENNAFDGCEQMVHVETHDGIRKVGGINLKSAIEIDRAAFYCCRNLESVEFGENLEIIGGTAFHGCSSLERLNLPSIIVIEEAAFYNCKALTDIELSERLETIESAAFRACERLQRIAIPLKRNLFSFFVRHDHNQIYNQFDKCDQLTTVDLVGGIHTTVASLHMESWKTEMKETISRINQVLPDADQGDKIAIIRQWMDSVIDKMVHYKAEHYRYVKEAITLLELALWKAKLGAREDNYAEGRTRKTKTDVECARRERRVICGADTVIKNVLPFLYLE